MTKYKREPLRGEYRIRTGDLPEFLRDALFPMIIPKPCKNKKAPNFLGAFTWRIPDSNR